jgi:hypothetical protein
MSEQGLSEKFEKCKKTKRRLASKQKATKKTHNP